MKAGHQPVYPGIELKLGDRVFVVPPLSLGQLQRFQSKLTELPDTLSLESVGLFQEVVYAALTRNYPDLGMDELAEVLDLGNMMEAFGAVMDVSGLKRREAEAKKAQAAASTGTNSTAT